MTFGKPKIMIYRNSEELVMGFTQFFEEVIPDNSARLTVALSGGSTPKTWFDFLSGNKRNSIDWHRIYFFWGDERCVPPHHQDSNYGMTKKYLLDHIDIPPQNVHRIKGEFDAGEAARYYSNELIRQIPGDGIPKFDLVILGLGEDGHTASLFPHEIELWDSHNLCVVASHPVTRQQRISISGRVINNASKVVFLVTGKNKSEKVAEIINSGPNASKYPASLVNLIDGQLFWFLDDQAASKLDR